MMGHTRDHWRWAAAFVAVGLAAVCPCRSSAVGPDAAPGVIGFEKVPLHLFARSPATRDGCRLLQNGQLSAGVKALRKALAQQPGDLVAIVGLTQAAPLKEQRTMLADRKAAVDAKDTPLGEFKLGVVAWCLVAKSKYNGGVQSTEEPMLSALMGRALQRACQGSRDPFLWYFVGIAAFDTTGLNRRDAFDRAAEGVLGPSAYARYARARDGGWSGPLPEVPSTQPALGQLEYIVRDIIAARCALMIHANVVIDASGHSKETKWMDPQRPDQIAARKYLKAWLAKIKDRIGQPG